MPPLALAASRILYEDPGRLLPFQRLQRGKNSGPGLGGALDLFRVASRLHAVGGEDAKLVAETAGRGGGLRRGVRRSRACGGGGGSRAGRGRRLRRGGPCLGPAKVVEDAFDGEPIEEGGRRRSRVAGSCGVGSCSLGNRGGSGRGRRLGATETAGQGCGDHRCPVQRRHALGASRGLVRMVLGFRGGGASGGSGIWRGRLRSGGIAVRFGGGRSVARGRGRNWRVGRLGLRRGLSGFWGIC